MLKMISMLAARGKIEWRSGEWKSDVDDVNHNNYLDYGHSVIDPSNRHTAAA